MCVPLQQRFHVCYFQIILKPIEVCLTYILNDATCWLAQYTKCFWLIQVSQVSSYRTCFLLLLFTYLTAIPCSSLPTPSISLPHPLHRTQVSPFDDHQDPYTENMFTCGTGEVNSHWALNDPKVLPYFVTLVKFEGQQVDYNVSWVHVEVVRPVLGKGEAEQTVIAPPLPGMKPHVSPPGLTLNREDYAAGGGTKHLFW